MSVHVVPALLRPTARAMRWRPFLAAAGLGLAVVAVPAAGSVVLTGHDLVTLMRIAALCGALGATFLLDDPATRSLAAVPAGRALRYAVRAGLALPALAAWWAAVLAITVAGTGEEFPTAGLRLPGTTLEAAAILALALGLAVLAGRGADGTGSTAAGAGLLLLTTGIALLPERAALFVVPDDPRWRTVHGWWALLLATAVVTSVCAAREPLSRRR
jgi:hypothetical protein